MLFFFFSRNKWKTVTEESLKKPLDTETFHTDNSAPQILLKASDDANDIDFKDLKGKGRGKSLKDFHWKGKKWSTQQLLCKWWFTI